MRQWYRRALLRTAHRIPEQMLRKRVQRQLPQYSCDVRGWLEVGCRREVSEIGTSRIYPLHPLSSTHKFEIRN